MFVLEFEISSLHRDKLRLLLKQGGAAPGFSPDDGSGKKEIYRIENFELAPVDPSAYGMFFGGDSYVIKYTYNVGNRERYIIYFWQVRWLRFCFEKSCIQSLISNFPRVMIAPKTKRPHRLFKLWNWIMKFAERLYKSASRKVTSRVTSLRCLRDGWLSLLVVTPAGSVISVTTTVTTRMELVSSTWVTC